MTTPAPARTEERHWAGFTLAAMAGWILVGGVLLVTRGLFEAHYLGTYDWYRDAVSVAGHWGLNAALTPFIVWVVSRFPIERGRIGAAVPVQVSVLLVGPIVHVFLRQAWLMALLEKDPLTFQRFAHLAPEYLVRFVGLGIPPFAVVLGAANAWYFFLRSVDQARAAASLELERARLEASLAEARLAALQAQLQPHFLFNALHAISTLILKGEQWAANDMLAHVSRFLRMTLDHADSPAVPLALELEFLEAYLSIQRVRFGDRLAVEMAIEERARSLAVPRLVLQPLVENAIQHGFASDPGEGRLAVRASTAGGFLTLEVEDNGRGLGNGNSVAEGVGLRNIRQRLEQLYPSAHSLTLGTASGGGALARIVIPAGEPHVAAGGTDDVEP